MKSVKYINPKKKKRHHARSIRNTGEERKKKTHKTHERIIH